MASQGGAQRTPPRECSPPIAPLPFYWLLGGERNLELSVDVNVPLRARLKVLAEVDVLLVRSVRRVAGSSRRTHDVRHFHLHDVLPVYNGGRHRLAAVWFDAAVLQSGDDLENMLNGERLKKRYFDRFDRRSLRWDREWCRTVIRGYCRRWFWLRLIYRGSRKAVPGDGEQCRQDERFFG